MSRAPSYEGVYFTLDLTAILNRVRTEAADPAYESRYAKIEALVEEIAELLSVDSDRKESADFPILQSYIESEDGVIQGNLEMLRSYLEQAYSIEKSASDEKWGGDNLSYPSLYSPYGIYVSWLKANKYDVK